MAHFSHYIAQSVLEQRWHGDSMLVQVIGEKRKKKKNMTISYLNYKSNYAAVKSIRIALKISTIRRPDNPDGQWLTVGHV